MGMRFVDRAGKAEKYFTDEENDRVVEILRLWIPARRRAIAEKKPLPQIPVSVVEAIVTITKRTSTRYNYHNYPFREDMVSEAVVNMLKYVHTFDPGKEGIKGKVNFFSWVTTCIDRSFSKEINSDEQQRYIKMRSFEEHGGFAAVSDDPDFQTTEFVENTGINMDYRQWMGEYEIKRQNSREKDREKANAQKREKLEAKMPVGLLQYMRGSK